MRFGLRVRRLLLVAGVMLAMFGGGRAWAQGLGRINGLVTDATGAAVPGATVTAKNNETGAATTVKSDAAGQYVFPSLPPAGYTVTVSAPGFATFSDSKALLQADQALTVNAGLKTGSASETVEANTTPPQVDVTTGTLSQVIDEKRVNDLPLNGRNAATLTTLVPGVVVASSQNIDQGQTKTFPVVAAVTINGTRANQVNYMLDGGNNVDEYTNVNAPFPMPDVLQEFSVETSNYNAEYGQNAGGVVNIITRGGANTLHGDGFEFVRNRVFNAANYFSYLNGVKTRDFLKRNQFGGTVNGPIRIPHLYDGKDRTFFSFGVQATRVRNNAVGGTATLPTPAQLAGTFSGISIPLSQATPNMTNPFTGTAYPCTQTAATATTHTFTCQVNPADYNASSLALLKFLPAVDASGTFNYFKPVAQNFIEYTARGDHQINPHDHLELRYFYDHFENAGVLDRTDLLSYSDQATINYHNALLSEAHTFSANLLNNFIASYQIDNAGRGPIAGAPNVNDLGVNVWQPAFKQINQVQLVNFFTIGDNPAATFRRNNYTFSDDLHWVKGNHTLAFGAHVEIAKVDIDNQFQQPGIFQFNSNNFVQSPVADFLLGGLTSFQQASGQYFNNRYHVTGYYAQDQWKVNRHVSLNYGVRYEPFFPQHEKLGRQGQFSPALRNAGTISLTHPNAPAGLTFPGDPGFVDGMIHPVYSHLMPRFGFAVDVFGDGKTSIRGGVGEFFDTRLPGVFENIFANTVPYVASVSLFNSASSIGNFSAPYAGTTNPFPAPQPPPASYFTLANYQNASYSTFDPNTFRVPVTYSYNLSFEQQMGKTLSGRLAYVGSLGRHQINPLDINPVVNQGASTATVGKRLYNASSNAVQNYPSAIALVDSGGSSNYNSLQASLQKRVSNGLTAFVNYTWSKAMDNNAFGSSVTAVVPGSSYVLPVYEPNYKRLDNGPADYDHTNVLSVSYVWTLPKWGGGNAWARYAVNGWQTNGIVLVRSGDRLTVTGANNSGTALGRDRAIWNGQNPYRATSCAGVTTACKGWLNPAVFTTNPVFNPTYGKATYDPTQFNPLTYGNIVKGSFVGPRYVDWDASVFRDFPLHERLMLQFRAEFFNVLNHTNFGDPQQVQTNGSFGRITSASDPRIGQLSLKLSF